MFDDRDELNDGIGEGAGNGPEQLVAACRRLYAAIDDFDQAAADALKIGRTDLRCLNLLETGPLAAGAIASQLRMSTGAVTALVDRLESAGCVERVSGSTDRRTRLVRATPRVFATIGVLYRGFADAMREIANRYGSDECLLAIRHFDDASDACRRALP